MVSKVRLSATVWGSAEAGLKSATAMRMLEAPLGGLGLEPVLCATRRSEQEEESAKATSWNVPQGRRIELRTVLKHISPMVDAKML